MRIEVNHITLNYVKSGHGKPLLLLHGNGEDLHIFDKLSEKLKKDFTVYAIDSRNHGESSKGNAIGYDCMAEDIYQFIKVLELRDVSVIGFSDGAIVSILLSLKYPGLFSKMVLLGPNLKPSDFKKNIYKELVAEYEISQDPLLKLMVEEPDIELKQLKAINIPAFVIGGEDDIFYRKLFRDIAGAINGAKLKIIEGHDHGSYIVDNDLLYPYVSEFLKG